MRELYNPEMTKENAAAVFWIYRNQLLFDQDLHNNARCKVVFYDDMAQSPGHTGAEIARFAGIRPKPAMWRQISASSVRRDPRPQVDEPIRVVADDMLSRLTDAYERGRKSAEPASMVTASGAATAGVFQRDS